MSEYFVPPIHGRYELNVQGGIVTLDTTGPWNEELVKALRESTKPLIAGMAGRPWAVLVLARGEPIHIPESRNLAIKTTRETREQGRVATALVIFSDSSKKIYRHFLEEQYIAAEEPYRFFDTEEEARAWLKELLSAFSQTQE